MLKNNYRYQMNLKLIKSGSNTGWVRFQAKDCFFYVSILFRIYNIFLKNFLGNYSTHAKTVKLIFFLYKKKIFT